ncbi:response regulator transcription factor [Brevibacillus choshinensis]|uniref:Response regulator transcription factor n=1 Tax=Brevibacillus choshinensis TaxID=54911 RepID=A0ABX7FTW8_BRECH|nr:response regulator transcription factor [Brevibacillus choshinensis]QRG69185.1 response regulator transcription factor [Brevibacillus choshinensis]
MTSPTILIADDDPDIVRLLAESFQDEGFLTIEAQNGKEALEKALDPSLSLILLDIMMPEMDGLDVCRKIRNSVNIPILFLSAKDRELDRVIGLEVGADDYILKPFSISELIARVRAHLRRENRYITATKSIHSGSLTINKDTFEVFHHDKRVELSTKEFQILLYLAENANRVLSREQIYNAIWGESEFGDINTVTVHIKNLRSKLEHDKHYIKTVWGIGYKFVGDMQ